MDMSNPGLRRFKTDFRAARDRDWYWHPETMNFYPYDSKLWALSELQRGGPSGLPPYFGANPDDPSDRELERAFTNISQDASEIRKVSREANIVWSTKTFKYYDAQERSLPTSPVASDPLKEYQQALHRCVQELQAGVLPDSNAYHECVERARIVYEDKLRSSKPS